MIILFYDMIHKEVGVYVDDMIGKSKGEEDHAKILRKLFERIREFKLQLNPKKYTFRVTSGKLLRIVVNNQVVEVDPDKIKAIQEIPEPKTKNEVRVFLIRLNYIARFISQLTYTCMLIF